jgi:hypothetical protein
MIYSINKKTLFADISAMVCIAYFCTLPFGPSLFQIFGIKLDVLIGCMAFLLSINNILKIRLYSRKYIIVLIWYLIFYLFTVLINFEGSNHYLIEAQEGYLLRDYIIVVANAIFSFTSGIVLATKINLLQISLRIASLIASLLLLLNIGSASAFGGRIIFINTLDGTATDPNTVAIGICLCAIFSFSSKKSIVFNTIQYIYLFVILISLILIASRTAISALLLSLFLLFVFYKKKSLSIKKYRNLIILLLMFSVFVFVSHLFYPDALYGLISRFTEAGRDVRLENFQATIDYSFSNKLGLRILTGKPLSDGNPHNEILFHLYRTGLIGAVNFIALFYCFYIFIVRKIKNTAPEKLTAVLIFLFICICIQTYWATKNLWLAMALINVIYLNCKYFSNKDMTSKRII